MKAIHIILLSIVLGGALGSGITWARFHESPQLVITTAAAHPRPATPLDQPKVMVESHFHDFGQVEHNIKISHDFKVTNIGDKPLELEPGTTTCTRCTIATIKKNRLEPGETTVVTIEYTPTQDQPVFRQHATIKTNDPRKLVELNIEGTVASRLRVVPKLLVLSRISASETKTADIKVYDYAAEGVSVESCDFLVGQTAPYFEAEIAPIPADELADPAAKSGCRVRVTVKPGLPVGPIRQTIRLMVKAVGEENARVMEIDVEGAVDGDISLVGRGWDSTGRRLAIGEVHSARGAKRTLYLMLRGPRRNETTITPAVVDPAWLKVSLGEPRELAANPDGSGGVTQIPLTIEIPPGTPPVNHLGSDQGEFAKVVLETNNPDVKQIMMNLQFVVLK